VRNDVPVYRASGNRDTTAEEEVEILKKHIEDTGAKAVKLKVGGRMSNNADSLPGRTEKLIPLARKILGDAITIHADSNGSYDAEMGIKIGRMCQEQNFHFFEEPCPFDHLEETKKVADALEIPIAGGEQETSLRRFRWMIENDAVQVVQPDLHYNGGMIRASRVARMAALKDIPTTVHMSGGGVGFVDMLNFCSFTPHIGAFQEYKGDIEKVGSWYDPPLRLKDGFIAPPTGPGLGLASDEEFIKGAKKIG
jgi:L-alanine-DL-glutamate epimerase-like enolase superfamily enzyme